MGKAAGRSVLAGQVNEKESERNGKYGDKSCPCQDGDMCHYEGPNPMKPPGLRLVPLTLAQANALVGQWHRHHKLAVGHRWSIGVEFNGRLVGAVIVGRPVARMTPQYSVCEAIRCVTDETKNACSKLYSACARAADAMGFDEIQTFILGSESGVSLIAAGWKEDTERVSKGGDWNRPSRGGRRTDQSMEAKRRFYKRLSAGQHKASK